MTFSYELGGALPAFCQKSPCKIFRIPISVNRRKTDDRLTAGVLDPKGFGVLHDLPGRREAAGLSSLLWGRMALQFRPEVAPDPRLLSRGFRLVDPVGR